MNNQPLLIRYICQFDTKYYLRLKQSCRKFWTVVNSGMEEAYTGSLYITLDKTIIDLKM